MSENPDAAARREARRSFLHKLGIVGVALLGYAGLIALGTAKHDYAKKQKEVWQLTPGRLVWFANKAIAIAPKIANHVQTALGKTTIAPQEPPHPADVELLRTIAKQFQAPSGNAATAADPVDAINSRQELVAAIEQLADACVWRETSDLIDQRTKEAQAPRSTPAQGERLFDVVAGQEAYARARIAGLHALIEATATQIERTGAKPPLLQRIFDEKHPLYVLYELSWFTLLALAVLATAWLLMILFTVLPFTSSEGHWTKKIADILERAAPSLVAAGAALPMAAAALIAATAFVGTSLATTPGGYSRTTNQFPKTEYWLEAPPTPPHNDVAPILAAISNAESSLLHAGRTGAFDLEAHLVRADEVQQRILRMAKAATAKAAWAGGRAELAEEQARIAAQQSQRVPEIAENTEHLVNRIGVPVGTTVAKQVVAIEQGLRKDETEVTNAHVTVQHEYSEEHAIRQASLAQATLVDRRGLFWRTFGRTQFQVGPAVVHQMAAALGVTLGVDGKSLTKDPKATLEQQAKEQLVARLIAAEQQTPLRSNAFLKMLHGDNPAQADVYDRQLLHLCALGRD